MQKNTVKITFFLVLFLLSNSTFSQQGDYIIGKLLDAKTQEPIPFASIRIKDRALGIISNVDGSFRIPLRYKAYGDIIEISSMGYETKEILISEFRLEKINIVSLNSGALVLQEAIVKGKDKSKKNLNAKQIVQRAIDAIPRNNPSTSFSTIGYYRDYQFKDKEYINLNEAILEVFDQGIDQLDDGTSKTRLFNFSLNEDFKQDAITRMAYDYETTQKIIEKAHLYVHGGNEFRTLKIHDAIRNYNVGAYDFVGTLKTDFVKNHFFLRSRDTWLDNEEIYTIKFWVFYPNYSASGNIYISKVDFAIHKLEYTMYDEKKKSKNREKNKHGHRQKVIFDVITDYRKVNTKMYLNYISFHNSFQIRKPPKFVLDSILVNAPEGYYMLHFNRPLDSVSAKKNKNYDIIFKHRKFGIEKIEVFNDSVRIHPKISSKTMINSMRELDATYGKTRSITKELLDVRVKNIKDVDGNVINQMDIEDYLQFREFFVQRIKPDSRAPLDNLFMNMRKPIFTDQPITKPKDYEEYWMNTPLQSIEN